MSERAREGSSMVEGGREAEWRGSEDACWLGREHRRREAWLTREGSFITSGPGSISKHHRSSTPPASC